MDSILQETVRAGKAEKTVLPKFVRPAHACREVKRDATTISHEFGRGLINDTKSTVTTTEEHHDCDKEDGSRNYSTGYFNHRELSKLFSIVRGIPFPSELSTAEGSTDVSKFSLPMLSSVTATSVTSRKLTLPRTITKTVEAGIPLAAHGCSNSLRHGDLKTVGALGTAVILSSLNTDSSTLDILQHSKRSTDLKSADYLQCPGPAAAQIYATQLHLEETGSKVQKMVAVADIEIPEPESKGNGIKANTVNITRTDTVRSGIRDAEPKVNVPVLLSISPPMEKAANNFGVPLPTELATAFSGDFEMMNAEGSHAEGSYAFEANRSRSRSWLPSEDDLVRTLVTEHGPRKWKLIATRLTTKTQKQVYARWRDYLQPGLTTKPWSRDEQTRLIELQAHVGNQWAVLARLMPGRSPNAIKNRFHATKRKLERRSKKEADTIKPVANDSTRSSEDIPKKYGHLDAVKVSSGIPSSAIPSSELEMDDDESLALEGLLLADTPTALTSLREREDADNQFDSATAPNDATSGMAVPTE